MLSALRTLTAPRRLTCASQLPREALLRAFAAEPQPPSHYEVLGLQNSATAEEIKSAFRRKAKDLHPDLKASFSAADGEAFLRLVAAYEVLNDPQQRQLYDITSNSRLPGPLKRAAAAAAAAAAADGSGSSSTEDGAGSDADPFAWRYGMSDWARQGPGSVPATADDSSRLCWSVMSALAKHQHELERDLHAALLKAFLGPKLQVLPGQLPGSFEADERAHPSLSSDLLHLVHGRTLLGVVRLQQPLQIEGDSAETAALPGAVQQGEPSSLPVAAPVLPPGDPAAAVAAAHAAEPVQHHAGEQQEHRQHLGQHAGAPAPEQSRQANGEASHTAVAAEPAAEADDTAAAAVDTAAADDNVALSESQWEELLRREHPLRGCYEWQPAQPLQLPAAVEPAGTAARSQDQVPGTRSGGYATGQHAFADECLGGRAAKQAWEAAWQEQHAADQAGPADGHSGRSEDAGDATTAVWKEKDVAAGVSGDHSSAEWEGQLRWQQESSTRNGHVQQDGQPFKGMYQQEQKQQQQPREPADGAAAETCGEHSQQQPPPPQQQQQQQKAGPGSQQQGSWLRQKQQRLMRWLRSPTADWSAADWSFDDGSESVLVLQLLMADGRVAAVSVRDDKQPAKPTKVYIGGVFTAAVLDDIVMEPLTGRLMGILYKYYTPGVHHLYFYLPGTQGSRVIARLQRRWMPPSSTWLFRPLTDTHDRGGWVVEWEGHEAQHKPGWMHPAVFVLTAGCYSYDMEVRRHAGPGASALQERAADWGRQLGQALEWLRLKR